MDWNPLYLYLKAFNNDSQAAERFLTEIGFAEWNIQNDAGRPMSETVAELCILHPQHCRLIRLYDECYLESLKGAITNSVIILRYLSAAGFNLYGLSNWPAEKFRLVRPRYDFFNLFDDIIISGEVRLVKPDERIFHLLLERISRPADECLLIDDSACNIQAALALGFQTIHFRSSQQLEDELVKRGIWPVQQDHRYTRTSTTN